MRKLTLFVAVALFLGMGGFTAKATTVTLSDGNSTVLISPDTQSGADTWIVDDQDNLFQQWFWYRIGDTGGEASIDTLALNSTTLGFGTRGVEFSYSGSGFEIELTYLLTGGTAGSLTSDLAESILITNTGSEDLVFRFFEYSDFDLNGTDGGQTVNLTGSPVNTAVQTGPAGAPRLSETVVVQAPTFYEANTFANTRTSLNDGSPTTLNGSTFAFGDATWAFQWNFNLATVGPGSSFLISKDKLIRASEPASLSLLLLGTGVLAIGRRLWSGRCNEA